MGISAPVPSDIINKILDEISDDSPALRVCSLAARSFYEPTRRYLFAKITLGHPWAPSSLNQILVRNPKISGYIRSMEIPFLPELTISEIIPVLPALSQVRRLILGLRDSLSSTHPLPLGTPEVLSVILQLPRLDTLEITSIRGFPANLLHIPHGLKHLILENVILSLSAPEPTTRPLFELISLHLNSVWSWEASGDVWGINTPNLLQVVVANPEGDVWEIMRAGVESIETVIWDDYIHGYVYPEIKLEKLTQLRHLCVVLSGGHDTENRDYDPIHTMLHTTTVAQRLEEFTFIIRSQNGPNDVSALGFLVLGSIWSSLADKFQFPRMKKVAIRLVGDGLHPPTLSTKEFHSVVSQRLIPVAEAGLLHADVCKQLDWNDFL